MDLTLGVCKFIPHVILIKNSRKVFDFEKLDVYQVLRKLNFDVFHFLNTDKKIEPLIKDQWKRASLGVMLSLAEGTGRISVNDKKHYITMARGNINESVTLLQFTFDNGHIKDKEYAGFYEKYEQVSKMLLGMYRSYSK
ncbi:MAG: four helix bundle protein [Bacteroidetes bacterium]|nr:four helix bundle protein [Bacteroidota bacterium]